MNYIKLIAVACTLLVLASCKKFLDTDSPSSFDQAYVFSNESDATKGVYGIYALFNQDAYTSRLANIFTGNTDVEAGGVSNALPNGARQDMFSFETQESYGDLRIVWNNAYSAINKANLCIEGIEASPIAANPEMQQLLGEAKALRALWYYWLMNHWGDVPFKISSTKSGDNFYIARTGRDTILTTLINDLIAIEPKMKPASQITYGIERVNREFVMGLISRLALMRGGYWLYPDMVMRRKDDYKQYYQIARDYCDKLIKTYDRPLNPNFAQIFENECKWIVSSNDDVLFEVAFQPGAGDVGWNHGIKVDAGSHPYGTGSAYIGLTPTYYHSFDTLDKRLPVTCSIIFYNDTLQQVPVRVNEIAPGKWNRLFMPTPSGPQSAKGTGINWPIMRYSDVLLMFAESENELNEGPTAAAINALKRVRERAFAEAVRPEKVTNYLAAVSVSKDAFFNAIVDERAWEFGGECIRKYDLARWNLFGKKIAETRRKLIAMGADAVAGVGQYSNLPDVLYYKFVPDNTKGAPFNKTVVFYNKYKRADIAPTGYLKANWLNALFDTKTSGPSNYILYSFRGYKDDTGEAPLRYIYPLHTSTVTASMGSLNNYGYNGFK